MAQDKNEVCQVEPKTAYLRIITTLSAAIILAIATGVFGMYIKVTQIDKFGSKTAMDNEKRISAIEYKTDNEIKLMQGELKYMNERLCEIKEICKRLENQDNR